MNIGIHHQNMRINTLTIAAALLLNSISPVFGQACSLDDTSEIVENSHAIIHDFDAHVPGCKPDFGPSGIVYHPILDRLIVISDKGGQFATMKTDGSEVDCRNITDALGNRPELDDYEGVTFADANDGFIYVGVESSSQDGIAIIQQVELSSATVTASWRIGFPGGIKGNRGMEGLTFVRDASHAEGGTFFIGDQTARKVIGKCELPIRTGGDTAALYGCSVEIVPQFDEVSGLDYAADAKIGGQTGVVLLSSDEDDKIKAYTPDGAPLDWVRNLPNTSSPGQEGHAINGCELYISSDDNDASRKIHRYRFSP